MITLTLTKQQLDVIAIGLGNLPFNQSANVINEISAQYEAQTKQAAATPAAEKTILEKVE